MELAVGSVMLPSCILGVLAFVLMAGKLIEVMLLSMEWNV